MNHSVAVKMANQWIAEGYRVMAPEETTVEGKTLWKVVAEPTPQLINERRRKKRI